MKNWLTSPSGTLILAAIAFLTFAGYTFLSALVLGNWNLDSSMAAISIVVVVILTGVWLWALLFISQDSKGALIAVLILSLLNILAGGSDILVFCPTPCQGYWPLAEIWHWVMVLTGLIATISVGLHLRRIASQEKNH